MMSVPNAPNWLRIIIAVLTVVSFLPQLLRLGHRKESSGISLYYVLFNLINASEQFALSFFFIVNRVETNDVFAHDPPDVGDWLNLALSICAFVPWTLIFILCLIYPADNDRIGHRPTVAAIFLSFLLISVIPVLADAIIRDENENCRQWEASLFHGVHAMLINPVVSGLCISAFWVQAQVSMSRPEPAVLSLLGLAAQAVVFMMAALSWPWMVVFPWEDFGDHVTLQILVSWYQLVGWVAVNNGIFSLAQAGLFWLLYRRQSHNNFAIRSEESRSLLGHSRVDI